MSKVRFTIQPNIEKDTQTQDFDNMDTSLEEWEQMTDEQRKELLYECMQDTIYGMVTSYELVD